MNDSGRADGEPVGSRVRMDCGHDVSLPWDIAPEVAVAELLRHRALCAGPAETSSAWAISGAFPGWLPIPGARR